MLTNYYKVVRGAICVSIYLGRAATLMRRT